MKEYFYQAFDGMTRFAPGSTESTLRAMKMYKPKGKELKILDIGCGIGAHTLLLAENYPEAEITAIDIHKPHIDTLNETAKQRGVSDRVHGEVMSMFEMSFPDGYFDLIWAEGSIYIAGFSNGLRDWKRFLKSEGYLICSEISWITDNPSKESRSFWNAAYSQMDFISNKIKQIEGAGYVPQGYFICPVTDWTENYYNPLRKNLDRIAEEYGDIEEAMELVTSLREEADLYERNSEDYSYVFYAMKKCRMQK